MSGTDRTGPSAVTLRLIRELVRLARGMLSAVDQWARDQQAPEDQR
jgi:hypothetical protein